MSSTQLLSEAAAATSQARRVDMKLEVVVIPVADVERAKRFYVDLGWRVDADFVVDRDFRVMQFTPPGSPCSIHFGAGLTSATPGSAQGLYLVVSDIVAARADLIARGVEVSEPFHRVGPGKPAVEGLHPQRGSYFSYASFKDPDGNTWLLQEVTTRFPGRIDAAEAAYSSSSGLASALRRAAAAHGEHENRTPGRQHDDWSDWYANYLFAEQAGKPLPT
jgi:catechol 2,3-dioxygenase-like lactoylglutathione lyase family enzyme